MKDTRTAKHLLFVLEANDDNIAYASARIKEYQEQIEKATKANKAIYMEFFYRRQPSDRPKEKSTDAAE